MSAKAEVTKHNWQSLFEFTIPTTITIKTPSTTAVGELKARLYKHTWTNLSTMGELKAHQPIHTQRQRQETTGHKPGHTTVKIRGCPQGERTRTRRRERVHIEKQTCQCCGLSGQSCRLMKASKAMEPCQRDAHCGSTRAHAHVR